VINLKEAFLYKLVNPGLSLEAWPFWPTSVSMTSEIRHIIGKPLTSALYHGSFHPKVGIPIEIWIRDQLSTKEVTY
jgi:hypothetical protein